MAKVDRIPIARPDIGQWEIQNVQKSLKSGWITQGPFVEKAEEMLAREVGRGYAICTSSGTTALIAALMAIDIHPNSHICVPALTFAAVHNAVKLTGHSPHYLLPDVHTWQVKKNSCEFVKWLGNASITAPCYGKVESSGLRSGAMIEDAAESFGGRIFHRKAGSFGDISCVSFYANKICTSGEGGAVLTDDADYAKRLRTIINHGIDNKEYRSVQTGINGRMTDLQAAILCAQLERLPEMLKRRYWIKNQYRLAAADKLNWSFPPLIPGETPAPWLFAGVFTDKADLTSRCEQANIEWRPFFALPDEVATSITEDRATHHARWLSRSGVCLPLSSTMTDSEVNRVCEVIRGK